jgi:threonine/homoserine/homoserine lactone efflux protein
MSTEKVLCLAAVIVAGLLMLVFLLDAALQVPFGRASLIFDILAICGAAFILWQGLETYREFR